MDCPRCRGLMVSESYLTIRWDNLVEQAPVIHWRCVLCGEIWDPVIASNRTSSKPVHEEYAQTEWLSLDVIVKMENQP